MARDRAGRGRRRAAPLSLRARLAVLLGGVALFLVVTLAVQLLYQVRLADQRDEIIFAIDRAAAAVDDLRSKAVEQETAIRGYAQSGDPFFLEPYERARAAADADVDRLGELVADSPDRADELAGVAAALGAWREGTAVPVLEGDAAAARPDTRFAAVNEAVDALDRGIDADREEEIERLDKTFTAVIIAMFAQVGGLIILGGLITVALSRQVVRPLAQLGDDARQVAEGHLERRVQGEGSPELIRLGEDVEAMRSRIVDELAELTAIRADLEHQTAELVRSNDDLEQFAYVASHDLQEPLRKVSGFCQLLEKRYAGQLDDRAKEYIWYANDGARRMQDLINDLLAFSRVGRSTEAFRPVDLAEVTAEVLTTLAERIEAAGATVAVSDLPTVAGDRRLLAQVMQNLVGNALKFRREEPLVVDISAVDDGATWTISVSDNGIGVAPAYAEQIFTIFKRLHSKTQYEGTGIGLALAKKIVEYHGGRIWLDSGSAPGATFSFSLPHRPAPAPAPAPLTAAASPTEESVDDVD